MTKPQNIAAIEQATGRSWDDWLSWFAQQHADQLTHKQIAELAAEWLAQQSVDSPGWWSQSVAVAYEQSIGRRAPGQVSDGSFTATVSRTYNLSRHELWASCQAFLEQNTEFDDVAITNERTSQTPVRDYWRCDLGSAKVTWAVEQKTGDKSLLVITHERLASADDALQWRVFWTDILDGPFEKSQT